MNKPGLVLLAVAVIAVAGGILVVALQRGADGTSRAPEEARRGSGIPERSSEGGNEPPVTRTHPDSGSGAVPESATPPETGGRPPARTPDSPEARPSTAEHVPLAGSPALAPPASAEPALRFQLVDEDELPIWDLDFAVHVVPTSESWRRLEVRPDGLGIIRIPMSALSRLRELRALHLETSPYPFDEVDIPVPALSSGSDVDLGAFVVKDVRVLAAGIVLEESGTSLPGVDVSIHEMSGGGYTGGLVSSTVSGNGGNFTLRGRIPRRQHRLHARADRHYAVPAEPAFQIGQRDVRIVMREGRTLSGTVLIEPEFKTSVRVRLSAADDGSVPSAQAFAWADLDPAGHWMAIGLRPGVWSVDVMSIRGMLGSLATIDGVSVGAVGDSVLETPIDVRGKLKTIAVRVTDRAGAPIEGAMIKLSAKDPSRPQGEVPRDDAAPGVTTLLARAEEALEFEVSHPEFQTRALRAVTKDVVVVLERAPELRLRLQGRFPAGARITAYVNRQKAEFDAKGETAVRAPAGRYELTTHLDFVRADGVKVTAILKQTKPEWIVVDPATTEAVAITLDENELRELLGSPPR